MKGRGNLAFLSTPTLPLPRQRGRGYPEKQEEEF